MGLRTSQQYRDSLRDNRTVYFRGSVVPDVTTHPALRKAVDHASIVYDVSFEEDLRELTVVEGSSGLYSRYFHPPASIEDLQLRSRLIDRITARAKTLFPAIKEAGSDALFALLRVTPRIDAEKGTSYADRANQLFERCREEDLALAIVQTDVKGDRSRGPSQQNDPDLYLRIVDRTTEGIVVRGAKMHTSCTPNVNELVVLPTRALSADAADYAVAFSVPVDTPGVTVVTSPYGTSGPKNALEYPISHDRKMFETVTVFNDVPVPWDNVYMAGEHEFAGDLALAFVDYHRFTAISYKMPMLEALIGTAISLADMNGVLKAAHVRDKIVSLITYYETVKGLTELAALRAKPDETGLFVADALTTNTAKYHFAHGIHQAMMEVQDIAGGMLITAPAMEDFEHEEVGPMLRKYLAGAGVDGLERAKMMAVVSDLTTGEYGGYQTILALHAEGSLEAEKLMVLRAFDSTNVVAYARELAGLN